MKIFAGSLVLFLFSVGMATGQTLFAQLTDDFEAQFRILVYGTIQEPADNSKNPGNAIFRIPRYQALAELRPDLSLTLKNLDLSIKPRFTSQWSRWQSNDQSGESSTDTELFINEWLARIRINDRLFASYGRENLQWGPGWLLSPSNPFIQDTGRANPKLEIAGMDFARLVFLPNMAWTFSLISNQDKGHRQLNPGETFEKTHALKIDFSGEATYAGFILAHHEPGSLFLGAFGGWTVNDALLLYMDLSMGELPKEDPISHQYAFLAGASYTLESGPTVTLEFARQENNPDFPNRDTVMLQYRENDIQDVLNIVLGLSTNLDDDSTQLYGNAEYMAGDHTQFFINTTVNSGGEAREFGSFTDYQIMAGVEYFF